MIGYHVTRKDLLPLIMSQGLLPQVPADMDDIKAVYLFKTLGDMNNALLNWLGERMDEWEEETGQVWEEVYIKVDLTGLTVFDSVEYEWACLETISAERFLQITETEKELT